MIKPLLLTVHLLFCASILFSQTIYYEAKKLAQSYRTMHQHTLQLDSVEFELLDKSAIAPQIVQRDRQAFFQLLTNQLDGKDSINTYFGIIDHYKRSNNPFMESFISNA